MSRKSRRATVSLPNGVHRVVARSREYFYFQANRGTPRQGPRIPLPKIRTRRNFGARSARRKGSTVRAQVDTFAAAVDAFLAHCENRVGTDNLSAGTLDQYRRTIKLPRAAWGDLPAKGVRPSHLQALVDGLADKPGKANNVLGVMRAFSTWARARDHIEASITEGVEAYGTRGGHRPWTPEQIKAAYTELKGVVRKGVILYMYTGMRGSDAVRLGPTMIDEGGFDLGWKEQVKPAFVPGAQSCRSWPPKWRHGKNGQGRSSCKRKGARKASPTPGQGSPSISGKRATRYRRSRAARCTACARRR